MVLKKTSASILSSPKEMSITQMEEFIQMAKEVSFHVDEMMCSVYRPQDRATVYRNANTLATLLLNLARKTLDHLPPNDSSNNCKVLGLIITKIEDTISKFPQTN